jgi:hypothetical protein
MAKAGDGPCGKKVEKLVSPPRFAINKSNSKPKYMLKVRFYLGHAPCTKLAISRVAMEQPGKQ